MSPDSDLRVRTFDFAVRIVKLCTFLQANHRNLKVLANQLLKSGTSIGANVEEAKAAQSKADFLAKYHISLKEARETIYWLKLLSASGGIPQKRLQPILTECGEIAKMLAASLITAKKNSDRNVRS